MDLKKGVIVAALAGLIAFSAAGCTNDTAATSVAQQPVQSTAPVSPTTQAPSPDVGDRPSPPSNNGTMPAPPQGGIRGERPAMPEIDYATAAAKLGVTEEQLEAAIGESGRGPMDMTAAAQQLGVSEDDLREALGFPAGGPPRSGPPQDGSAPPASGSQTY